MANTGRRRRGKKRRSISSSISSSKRKIKAPVKKINRSKKKAIYDTKFAIIMHEFKIGTLKSSNGKKVFNRKQALAIAFSEAEKAAKRGTIVKPRRSSDGKLEIKMKKKRKVRKRDSKGRFVKE